MMSVSTPSCSPRSPQHKRPWSSAFRATCPTLVPLVFFVKRCRRFPSIFAAKQQQEAYKSPKKSGKRKVPEKQRLDEGNASFDLEVPVGGRCSHPSTLPKPPAGFVLEDHGRVLLASNKRIATIVSTFFYFLFPLEFI